MPAPSPCSSPPGDEIQDPLRVVLLKAAFEVEVLACTPVLESLRSLGPRFTVSDQTPALLLGRRG
jgi:hypothetical protein